MAIIAPAPQDLANDAFLHELKRVFEEVGDPQAEAKRVGDYLAGSHVAADGQVPAWTGKALFIDEASYDSVRATCDVAYAVLDKIVRAYRTNDAVRAQFGFDEGLSRLSCLDTGYECQVPYVRIDVTTDAEGNAFICGVDTTGAASMVATDELSRAMRRTLTFHEFAARHDVKDVEGLCESWADALLDLYHGWYGPGFPDTNPGDDYTYGDETMSLSIVGDREGCDMQAVAHFLDLFGDRGVHARFADVSELRLVEVLPGRLRLVDNDGPIACVWRRIGGDALLERAQNGDEGAGALIRAAEQNVACVVGGLRDHVAASDRLLVALKSEAAAGVFGPSEREMIGAFSPESADAERGRDVLSAYIFNGKLAGLSARRDGAWRPLYLL